MRVEYERFKTADHDGHRFVFEFFQLPRENEDFKSILQWGSERFGDPVIGTIDLVGSRWAADFDFWRVWFRDETDAFEFRMRWC